MIRSNEYNDPIPLISNLYIDLIKMCYEGAGYYLLETNNELEYKNYYVANPDMNTDGYNGGMIDNSLFKRNPSGWNIKKACNWLQQNSFTSSQHACAKYIRMAIEAGGVSTEGRPNWAWQYVNFLPKIGFRHIMHHNRKTSSYTPEPGDIAVYKKNGATNVPGHICMWTGVQWCSDFKQRDMYVYSTTMEADIYRFV